MTDIHAHIIPGIDDGAADMETALGLLSMAASSGVDTVAATPHSNIPGEFDNYASRELEALFARLCARAEEERIPVKLCRGMEVFATADLPALLKDGLVWTLNRTRYFLTEFAFDEEPDFCLGVLDECIRAGFRPIVAHPERYFFIQDDPRIAFEMYRSGCALQINKGSMLGRFGPEAEELAMALTDHGIAACIASDAHGLRSRSTDMTEIRRFLNDNYGGGCAKLLLSENPSRILAGAELIGVEPIPFRQPIQH